MNSRGVVRTSALFIVLILASLSLIACGSDEAKPSDAQDSGPPPSVAMFVGEVSAGGDIKVGLAVSEGRALLFFCGGNTNFAARSRWFRGPLASLDQPFSFEDAEWKVEGRRKEESEDIIGTVNVGSGAPLTWYVRPVAEGTVAGVYEASFDDDGLASLVVHQDNPNAPATGQGVFRNRSDGIKQVTPIMPIVLKPQGIEVQATIDGEKRTLFLLPARP